MKRSAEQLREDALAIWQAGVDAVRGDRLVQDNVRVDGRMLAVGDLEIDLAKLGRIEVVGTGKAGAGMAEGLQLALGEKLLAEKKVSGWLNVPADCVRKLSHIHLHGARPAGVNEPTAAGAQGTEEILRRVAALGPRDLCICLLSGGGSALLPAPIEGILLSDKLAVTRHLSAAGANIAELNTVRKQLSRVKGGGLARACRAGMLVTLVISDVIGDPLEIISSGPTVPDSSTPQQALEILDRYRAKQAGISPAVFTLLEAKSKQPSASFSGCHVTNIVIGNNAVAVDAAGVEAEKRGYSHAMHAATQLEGQAEAVGRHLAALAQRMRNQPGPDCLITGGEPVVKLAAASERGKGGRNQQLVLAALLELLDRGAAGIPDSSHQTRPPLDGIALLSGGTDGEDGPTDAAGALIDSVSARTAEELQLARRLDLHEALRRNDAYPLFGQLETLIMTGPTHTNVCDLRVVVVDRVEAERKH